MQPATPYPPVVQSVWEAPQVQRLPKPTNTHLRGFFLSPSIGAEADTTKNFWECSVLQANPPEFPSQVSDITLTENPTYKFRISYRPTTIVIHKTTCSLGTEAGVTPTQFSVIPNDWRNQMKRYKLLTLELATKQPLPLNGNILLPLRLNNFNPKFWLAIALNLAVGILLGTYFINCFIHSIFPPNRELYHGNLNQFPYLAV